MKNPVILDRVEFAAVRATEKTTWTFAEVYNTEGLCATTEITSGDKTSEAARLLTEMVSKLSGSSIGDEAQIASVLELNTQYMQGNKAIATAVSALRTAVIDLQAQYANQSLTETLGGKSQDSVALYANINRHLLVRERTLEAFAEAAERAAKAGFATIKCAAFDGIYPESMAGNISDMIKVGIERVAVVRDAIGSDIKILVDCHSHFTTENAPGVAEELAKLNIGWFEEPLEPTEDPVGLAQVTQKVSMPVAGGENGYGEEFFASLIEQGAINVIMPDIKYCGGVGVATRAGHSAMKAGGNSSPHSPSGPISLLAGAHVSAATPGSLPLEHAVYEADWRAELITPQEHVKDGKLWFPGGIGLGATLNYDIVNRYGRSWKS